MYSFQADKPIASKNTSSVSFLTSKYRVIGVIVSALKMSNATCRSLNFPAFVLCSPNKFVQLFAFWFPDQAHKVLVSTLPEVIPSSCTGRLPLIRIRNNSNIPCNLNFFVVLIFCKSLQVKFECIIRSTKSAPAG